MLRTFLTDLRLHRGEVLVHCDGELTFDMSPHRSKPPVLVDQEGTVWILRPAGLHVEERYVPVQGGAVECVYTRKSDDKPR